MVATILDLLRPKEREQFRAAAAGQVNPLTQEEYNRPPGLAGWLDLIQSPFKAGTPLGNIWGQMPQPSAEAAINALALPMEVLEGTPGTASEFFFGKKPEGIQLTPEVQRRALAGEYDPRRYEIDPETGEMRRKEEAKSGPQKIVLGKMPALTPMPDYAGATPPDFSAAISALGGPPERPEEPSLASRLSRALGGAAAAGAQMMRGTTGGESVAAALAGGAGGMAAAIEQIGREENSRKERWQQMVQTHNARLAELRANAESATSAFKQREAMAELHAEQVKIEAQRRDEMMKAPRVQQITNDGMVLVQAFNEEKGQWEGTVIDFGASWREKEFMQKMLAAQPDEVWLGGETYVKGADPLMRARINIVMDKLRDTNYRNAVIAWMTETDDVDYAEMAAKVIQQGSGIDWKNFDPMITMGALRFEKFLSDSDTSWLEKQIGIQR